MAVYTHITDEEARVHLASFDIGTFSALAGIMDGVSNTNYILTTTAGKYILTLLEERVKAEDLPFFVDFMGHLRANGIPCPGVVATRFGRTVMPLRGKPALITTFLEGASPKNISIADAAAMGAFTAQMHKAAAGFSKTRPNTMALPAWRTLIEGCRGKTEFLPQLTAELNFLEKNWPKTLPAGAVHADLFPDNVFLQGGKVSGVIDFYFACTDIFIYDMMLALNSWCFDKGAFNKEKAAAFLAAYERLRPLSEEERVSLRFFGRAGALRIVATRLYDFLHPAPGALITPKDPLEHLRILSFYQENVFP